MFSISVQSKLTVFQELFGMPFNRRIKLALIVCKPERPAVPEPIVSRLHVPERFVLTKQEDKSWSFVSWSSYPQQELKYKKRPDWECTLFGTPITDEELAGTAPAPLDTLAETQQLSVVNTSSLPDVLKSLCQTENIEQQISTLLNLHKRLYHRKSKESTALLTKAGIPSKFLLRVDEAISRCEYCRRWEQLAAKPAIKTTLSARFNQLVYCDLIYIDQPPMIFLVCVDDAIRVSTVWHVEYRDFVSLEQAFRHSWIRRFGPPRRLRCDKEGALAGEHFAVYAEKIGMTLELCVAGEHHGMLGPLDRRIQIIRHHAPILLDLLATECITIEYQDLAAEIEIDLNTQLTYGGIAPYTCLYGTPPRAVFQEDSECISMFTDNEPFFEHQQVRLHSIQAFQQALLKYRITKATTARPRKSNQTMYKIGDVVDIYRRPKHRDLQGWRGPATVIQLLGEGLLCVRWQSMTLDVPVHMIRPHISVSSTKELPPVENPLKQYVKDREDEEAAADTAVIAQLDQASSSSGTFFLDEHRVWEAFYNEEIADQLKGDHTCLDTLVSLTSAMPTGTSQIHTVLVLKDKLTVSREAERDSKCIWNVARQLATNFEIEDFVGVALLNGRRHLPALSGIEEYHVLCWINPDNMRQFSLPREGSVDFLTHDFRVDQVHLIKCICLLQGPKSDPSVLQMLLDQSPFDVEPLNEEPRVREELPFISPPGLDIGETSTKIASKAPSATDAKWDKELSSSEAFALQLRGISAAEYKHETQCATRYVEKSRSRPYAFLSNDCPMNFFAVESTSSSSHEPFRKPECLPRVLLLF